MSKVLVSSIISFLVLFLAVTATIPNAGVWHGLSEMGSSDGKTGACLYEKIAHDKYGITSLEITDVVENIDLPEDALNWFKALRPTVQTRITKPVRKEYRQLTSDERSALKRAFWKLQTNYFGGKNAVEMFSLLHAENISPSSTRDGPAQLGWHREYVTRFEEALRRYEPDLALPYWDVTLEADLDTVADSVIWSSELFGECEGDSSGYPLAVTNGPFANWLTPSNCYFGNGTLVRNCGYDYAYHGFNDIDMSIIFDQNNREFSQWITEVGGCLTRDHDLVHAFVGGNLHDCVVDCVVVDPVSWALHGFIDLIWETYRSSVQLSDLETDYPSSDTFDNQYHKASEKMRPFSGLYNIDGLSTIYTDFLYGYKKRVDKCRTASDCGDNTDYVFCNTANSRCMSKIKEDGECTSYSRQDSCVSGRCGQTKRNYCSSTYGTIPIVRTRTDTANICADLGDGIS